MDQLDAMRMFVRVTELESFTRSAEQLGVPKATLSAAIRRLEEQMGTRLLQRTTRRVQLTTDGRLCYARCQDLLADMEEFNGLFRQQGQLSGQLRVDMPGRMARHLVMPALPAFLAAHPALQLMLSSTDRRVDLVREGFDCVIRVGALEPSSLVARPLGHYRQINCASAAYLARYGTPRSLSELSGHRLVHYGGSSGPRESGFEYLQADGSRAVLAMSGALTVNDSESYLAAALAGLGIIQQPRVGVEPLLASGELVAILPKWQAPPLPIHALYAHRRQLAPRVQAFIQWLSGILASALGPDGPRDGLATRAGMDAAD
ncbi:LysR family transcriptional regulator [Aeromonas dhakensis]|uniref:LysR family transcriptional regulator n=1 Tax=Aeromonas dhakensis TaxID=196024 RepID=UPI001116A6A6|nr:LysR family transcriptional regulator [Aeromonas dhakensis]TNI36108.1 LysR family transcriptional regulator [Aeromonas dhakensis]